MPPLLLEELHQLSRVTVAHVTETSLIHNKPMRQNMRWKQPHMLDLLEIYGDINRMHSDI
jgi:hypothetical protein